MLYLRSQDAALAVPAGGGRQEAKAEPRMGRRAAMAGVLLAFAAAAGTAGWRALINQPPPESKVITDQEPINGEAEPVEDPPAEPEAPRLDSRPPSEQAEVGQKEDRTEHSPPPPSPQSTTITLRDGEAALLASIAAYATVDFLQLGPEFVRITVSPEGAAPTIRAVMGPGTIEAPSPRGSIAVDVVAIDWRARTVTVRGRLIG